MSKKMGSGGYVPTPSDCSLTRDFEFIGPPIDLEGVYLDIPTSTYALTLEKDGSIKFSIDGADNTAECEITQEDGWIKAIFQRN